MPLPDGRLALLDKDMRIETATLGPLISREKLVTFVANHIPQFDRFKSLSSIIVEYLEDEKEESHKSAKKRG
ncbi:MAG: hypothetical protein ACYCQI_12750 [Gammaproteobacteria bacterium]